MAYVTVPKDLSKVKTKFIFNLTKRQVFCFGCGILVGLPLFFLVRGSLPTTLSALLMIIVRMPFFMLALCEKNGEPLESTSDTSGRQKLSGRKSGPIRHKTSMPW